ncbi:hypothetical protein [Streptomyces sp. V1I1]|uniref:hypothetical protein n=1 Tax=Streptomyces sp. V1I1 TaxID=3042272 RepID=UPI0027897CFD|nr:hypothetical protein [Streptomyces sp. V1I1]MDQ0938557.1 hypothetical protein [Streptomyces sp. V1I1]
MEQPPPTKQETAAGINKIEGYLLYQAELRTARSEAEAFARSMPWLTTAEQDEIARRYAEQRVNLSKQMLRAIAARCTELNSTYTARYLALRRRLLSLSVACLLLSVALCVGLFLLS